MSLAHLLRNADARLRLDLVRPSAVRLDRAAAPPARLAPPLAARAVANGVRMELARRMPAARGIWPAEHAPEALEEMAPELADAAEHAITRATSDVERGTPLDAATTAEHALRLARLETLVRSGYVDSRIAEPEDPEDVAEVAAMLADVPWGELGDRGAPLPLFAGLADGFPDADPDALVGGTLLMVNASRAARVEEDDLRGLIARLVLARAEWGPDEAMARIESLGVLLARHGVLWRAPAASIVAHEAFPVVEAWLLKRVEQARREAAPKDEAEEGAPRRSKMPRWVRKRFAPRTPGTHPEGKAGKKKGGDPQPPRRSSPAPARAARRDPRDDEDGHVEAEDTQPRRARTPKPDWRRGSKWRRDRGL